jgi:hypothetical protein
MTGADIGLGWIDQTGQVHFQVNTNSLFIGSVCIYLRTASA